MRRVLLVLLLCFAGGGHAAELTYVSAGDEHEVAVLPAPLPQVNFGAFSVQVMEAAAGRVRPAPRPVTLVERGTVPAPLKVASLADVSRERVAAVRLRRAFQVGEELDRLKVLRLRARYQDGLVAMLNDVEIARRNVAVDAAPDGLAQRTRGAEWESIFIPVTPGMLKLGENIFQVEVRPSAARLSPAVDVELIGSDTARVVRGPILQRVTATEATLVFETDVPTLAEVRLPNRILPSGQGPSTRHVVKIDGLSPASEVSYQLAVAHDGLLETSLPRTFHTAPVAGEPVRFIVYGDVRSGHATHAELVRAIDAEAPDFVLATGDMVMRGSDEGDWQKFFDVASGLLGHIPLYPAIGNHDLGATSGADRRFEDVFALPARPADCPPGSAWYAFDVAGVHVVMLDSNRYSDDRQLSWLDADLAAARAAGARAIFATTHHGPYARGPHGGDEIAAQRYVPVLVRHGVSVLFSGHDHIYQRGRAQGLDYVVSGGGGAPLYPITCGVPGKPACKGDDSVAFVASAHHYVLVEVMRDDIRMCTRKPDGTPVEECVTLPLLAR